MLLAGVFAHDGYLRLDLVMLCGIIGSVSCDQAWFWVGRRFGRDWIRSHPAKTVSITRVTRLLERWGAGFVLIFRFLYGLRTISPIAIGLTSISPLRFTVLNMIGAAVWSVLVSGLGYVCGETIEAFLQSMPPWQRALVAGGVILLVAGCLVLLQRRFLRGQEDHENAAPRP